MVRNYQRKKEKVPREILLSALRQLKLQHDLKWGQSSYRTVAHSHGISKTTLFNHFQKVKHLASIPDNYFLNQAHHRQILKSEEEEELVGYLKLAMESNHSLTPTEVRKLVYSFVLGNGIQCPAMWHEYHTAGEDWFTSFMKRNQCLSLRKAEATSQARAAGFNYSVVHSYQDTLGGVFARHQYPPDRIINIDETSNQTVMAPETVVAIRGTKQVRQTTGAERGTNVSMICFGNAAGGFIPPAYVFPLKNVNRKSMNNSIPGSIAFANGTGWFDGNIMVDVIEHVQKYVQSSKENPVLIIWDNFSAHLDYLVVKKAKEYGMELLTLPPHTSHELQPLDVSVFVALKKYIKAAHMEWYRNNPGKRITIHEIAGLSKDPFYKAMTPANLISGFKRAGIYPFTMFKPDDPRFSSSLVTDLPATSQQHVAEALSEHEIHPPQQFIEIEGSNNIQTVEREMDGLDGMDFSQEEDNVPTREWIVLGNTVASTEIDNRQPMANCDSLIVQGPSSQSLSVNCETPLRTNVTVNRVRLAELMPIPKVIQNGPRQSNRTRTGKSRLLTDPEEMAQLEMDYLKKKKKDMEKENSKKTRADKPRLSNKENITENGKVVATKRKANAVHEKEPLSVQNRQPRNAVKEKEPLSVQNRQHRNAVQEKEPLSVQNRQPQNAVHEKEKEPLSVQNRQPRNARKPAFLTQNYFFD